MTAWISGGFALLHIAFAAAHADFYAENPRRGFRFRHVVATLLVPPVFAVLSATPVIWASDDVLRRSLSPVGVMIPLAGAVTIVVVVFFASVERMERRLQ